MVTRFDVVKMIDRELSLSNALLQDIGVHSFAASRVYGVESPRILAGQIRPNGWQPVDAEIRVTDPAQLARTLGGRNLYGQSAYAPIRELLQNAVDAIRARRKLEGRSRDWGRIKLTLETARPRSVDENWLHIDDTGMGMSERVLVGPLLDFGRSLWNSPLMQEEFPGLESRGIKPIGKYGIGFFSIFMLGERVNVISRPYKAGLEEQGYWNFPHLALVQFYEMPRTVNYQRTLQHVSVFVLRTLELSRRVTIPIFCTSIDAEVHTPSTKF